MKLSTYVTNAAFALLYAAVYTVCFVYYLTFHFAHFGFDLYPRANDFLALSVFLCVVPIVCYRGFRALSSVLAVFTYVLLYVPVVLTFALGSDRSPEEILLIQVTFMVCMCLLFLADAIIVRNPFDLQTNLNLPQPILVLTLLATLYLLVVYRGNLRLVSFDAVYEQRAANAALGGGLATRYLSAWLYTIMIPLCLAYGLVARKYRYFALGSGACVTLYLATAAKGAIVLPVIYAGIYILFTNNRLRLIYPLFSGALSVAMAALLLVRDTAGVAFTISWLVLLRTVGSGGLTTMRYYEFFSTHPQTSYTHINLVNMVTGTYPYANLGLGQVVGSYYWSSDMNANANFWATDGFAAAGLLGVPMATVLCVALFILLNAVTRGYNGLFVVLCFLPFLIQMLNTSLFSSVWSGGGFFLILFFLFNRRDAVVIPEVRETVPRLAEGAQPAAG